MGNIGRTIESYSLSRYQLDLDVLWTRFHHAIQASDKFFSLFQDAKTNLDMCVTLWWLTTILTAVWSVRLVAVARLGLFLTVAIVGPLLGIVWYRMAAQSYRVFADLLRSAVDLFRFDLLKTLALPLPLGPEEERQLWNQLSQQTGYRQPATFSYRHRAP
jgi:hypothetical protein